MKWVDSFLFVVGVTLRILVFAIAFLTGCGDGTGGLLVVEPRDAGPCADAGGAGACEEVEP